MIDLVTRAEWGAKEADGFKDRAMPFAEFWLHHSVTVAPDLVAPFTDDDAAVRTLERIGEERFGAGISYNQPITPVGRVYVGVSPHRVGAHTRGHNTVGFAFVLVGNYDKFPPTAVQEEMVARRMVELHRAGAAIRHTLNGGHTQASLPEGGTAATACPGAAALARIPAINARANALWSAGYGKPGTDVTPPLPKPPPASTAGLLVVDGMLGPRTIIRLQTEMRQKGYDVVVDGKLSAPSKCVAAVQRYLNAKSMRDREGVRLVVDGLGIQPNTSGRWPRRGSTDTVEALQRFLRVPMDGYLSSPSNTVRELQRRLNADTF